MARSELIVGLDIGTTKICVVVGELSPEGVDVVGETRDSAEVKPLQE